jgi:protein-disulfide isomerase
VAKENQPQGARAYAAFLAATRQERAGDMWDMIFANQDRHTEEGLRSMATQLDLDLTAFMLAFQTRDADLAIAHDAEEAARIGVASGPALVVNGRTLKDVTTLTDLKAIVD